MKQFLDFRNNILQTAGEKQRVEQALGKFELLKMQSMSFCIFLFSLFGVRAEIVKT
jgi:hypothetical protein